MCTCSWKLVGIVSNLTMDFTNLGHEETNTFQEKTEYDIPYDSNTPFFGSRNKVQKQFQIGLEDAQPIVNNKSRSNSVELDQTYPVVNAHTSNAVRDPAQTPNEQVRNKRKRTKDPIRLEGKRERSRKYI